MSLNRKILSITIVLIVTIEAVMYLNFHFREILILLYLLPFTFLIPVYTACTNIKRLSMKNENSEKYRLNLEKRIQLLEAEAEKFQNTETEFKKLIGDVNVFVFSFTISNNIWFMGGNFQGLKYFGMQDFQNGIRIIEENIHPEDKEYFLKMKNQWLSGTPTILEFRIENEGQVRWNELRTNSILNSSEEVERIHGMIFDVTERKEKEEKYAQLAFYDALTELPNRRMLENHFKKAFSRAIRKEHEVTIMFIDLDGFKDVNDSYGHDIGDALLKQVANRLNENIRDEDFISRIGGDEFIIVFEETSKEEITLIADRILQRISLPFIISGQHVSVTPSIGISSYPEDGDNLESIINYADKAMYAAKVQGKKNYKFYTPDLENYQPKESLIDQFFKWFQKAKIN
ncbi:sensor domain-containing diguanylate cyclase [Paenibacillus physcomitrellae]|uniref:Diguanylate cyclase n=1 Tax=Paenibacillus physcomitrellae TaxID=1619311 RepID=A0ABQ1G306_9BACL|nr:sensor domain-containing diguanylate cyclase [Paenibacillus physcomitrellae]GGA34540.1 hypothetical protein GCM10010917_19770 [Paenibacillus physcomitrellae]